MVEIFKKFYKISMINIISKQNLNYFSKFIIAGILNTLLDWGILNTLLVLTGKQEPIFYALFKVISFLFAALNSFLLNKYWVFKAQDEKLQILKFSVITFLGVILNNLAATLVTFKVCPLILSEFYYCSNLGAFAGTFISLVWNFLGYRFFAFKTTSNP